MKVTTIIYKKSINENSKQNSQRRPAAEWNEIQRRPSVYFAGFIEKKNVQLKKNHEEPILICKRMR